VNFLNRGQIEAIDELANNGPVELFPGRLHFRVLIKGAMILQAVEETLLEMLLIEISKLSVNYQN
jgi:hypothetical protein